MMTAMLAVDLLACITLMVAAGWLLTDTAMSRSARMACALVAAGACVDAIGMYNMLAELDGHAYGDVWPSETLVDVGFAALMVRWAFRLNLQPGEQACP